MGDGGASRGAPIPNVTPLAGIQMKPFYRCILESSHDNNTLQYIFCTWLWLVATGHMIRLTAYDWTISPPKVRTQVLNVYPVQYISFTILNQGFSSVLVCVCCYNARLPLCIRSVCSRAVHILKAVLSRVSRLKRSQHYDPLYARRVISLLKLLLGHPSTFSFCLSACCYTWSNSDLSLNLSCKLSYNLSYNLSHNLRSRKTL